MGNLNGETIELVIAALRKQTLDNRNAVLASHAFLPGLPNILFYDLHIDDRVTILARIMHS